MQVPKVWTCLAQWARELRCVCHVRPSVWRFLEGSKQEVSSQKDPPRLWRCRLSMTVNNVSITDFIILPSMYGGGTKWWWTSMRFIMSEWIQIVLFHRISGQTIPYLWDKVSWYVRSMVENLRSIFLYEILNILRFGQLKPSICSCRWLAG